MTYTPRYKFSFHNELNEFVEILLSSKDGETYYSGSGYFTISSTSSFILNLATGLTIDAIYNGNTITFDGHTFTIASWSYDGTNNYSITTVETSITGISDGVKSFIVGELPAYEELENISSCDINCNSDGGDILDPIITRELIFTIFLPVGSSIEFDTFLTGNYDDWKVVATIDGVPAFHGFLIPDESPSPFQDKPYEIELHATDGLKLLDKVTLKNYSGNEFDAKHNFIELIAACLQQTGLELDIRVYCNIYYNSMVKRDTNIQYDAFQQMYLDYRTFMKSSTEFVDCYTALQIMLTDHFRLYYEMGRWVIYRIPEYQYLASDRYYTDYHWTGSIIGGNTNLDDYAKVGKLNIIRPINESQKFNAQFDNKSIRHNYKYNIWDEIPRNKKFERGTLFDSAPAADEYDVDGDGNTSEIIGTAKRFTIDSWSYVRGESANSFLPESALIGSDTAYRRSVYDDYNVELYRELQLQGSFVSSKLAVLKSQSIPIGKGDKIEVSFQWRNSLNSGIGASSDFYAILYPDDGSHPLWLDNNDPVTLGAILTENCSWSDILEGLKLVVDSTITEYSNFTAKSIAAPKSGELVFIFSGGNDYTTNGYAYFKDFDVKYTPYVAGGYVPVTGDYWNRVQNRNVQDTYSKEIEISDSRIGVAKGTLFFFNGLFPKTNFDWQRYGLTESKHYKQLVNIGVYNLKYRKFWKIYGDFDGTKYEVNRDATQGLLSFTMKFRFEDLPAPKDFVMVCPLRQDIVKGRFNVTFQEVWASSADGTQQGDSEEFKYLFE